MKDSMVICTMKIMIANLFIVPTIIKIPVVYDVSSFNVPNTFSSSSSSSSLPVLLGRTIKTRLMATTSDDDKYKLYVNINKVFTRLNNGALDGSASTEKRKRYLEELNSYLIDVRADTDLPPPIKQKLMMDLMDVIHSIEFFGFMIHWEGKLDHLLLIKPPKRKNTMESQEEGDDNDDKASSEEEDDEETANTTGGDVFERLNSILVKLNDGELDGCDTSRILKMKYVRKLKALKEEIESDPRMGRAKKDGLTNRMEEVIDDINFNGFFLFLYGKLTQ
jgi:hypothetical protein